MLIAKAIRCRGRFLAWLHFEQSGPAGGNYGLLQKNNMQQLICTSRPFRFVCCPHFLIGLPVASPIVTPVQCTAQPCLDQGIAKQRHAKSQVSDDQRHQGRALQRARNRAAEDTCRKPSGHTWFYILPKKHNLSIQRNTGSFRSLWAARAPNMFKSGLSPAAPVGKRSSSQLGKTGGTGGCCWRLWSHRKNCLAEAEIAKWNLQSLKKQQNLARQILMDKTNACQALGHITVQIVW